MCLEFFVLRIVEAVNTTDCIYMNGSCSQWSSGYCACHWTKLTGSNLADGDGVLRVIKIRSTTFFGGKVNLVVPHHE
jgi:hypothetical protein